MDLTNTTHWPRHFIRRMLRWVAKEIHLPLAEILEATFRHYKDKPYRGRAYFNQRRIIVRIGITGFPVRVAGYKRAHRDPVTGEYETFHDSLEALVGVTAHELAHLQHASQGKTSGRGMEDIACARERFVLRRFRAERAKLEAEWSAAPPLPPEPAVKPLIDRRARKARSMLSLWERKLKRAQGKIKKYKKRVAYYDQLTKQTKAVES